MDNTDWTLWVIEGGKERKGRERKREGEGQREYEVWKGVWGSEGFEGKLEERNQNTSYICMKFSKIDK